MFDGGGRVQAVLQDGTARLSGHAGHLDRVFNSRGAEIGVSQRVLDSGSVQVAAYRLVAVVEVYPGDIQLGRSRGDAEG